MTSRHTNGAISAVAFGLPVPAVDGNVLRVVSRLFELEDDVLSPAARRNVTELVRAAYPPEASAFTQGLMELGETLCLPGAPLCDACPLRELCRARSSGRAALLPVRKARSSKRELTRDLYLIGDASGRLLFCRRPDKGVLAGLWDLPEESEGAGIGGAGSAGDTVTLDFDANNRITNMVVQALTDVVTVSGADALPFADWHLCAWSEEDVADERERVLNAAADWREVFAPSPPSSIVGRCPSVTPTPAHCQ